MYVKVPCKGRLVGVRETTLSPLPSPTDPLVYGRELQVQL